MYSIDGEPIWRQIAGTLESEIDQGIYEPGDRLPTENELSRRFAVNRHTVRRSMSFLQEMGKVRIEQGRGTFVQSDLVEYPIGERTRFTQNVSESNRLPSKTLLRAEQIRADATVSRNLGIRKGAPVALIEAVSEADGRPIGVATHYFPAKRFAEIIPVFRQTLSITESLKACGVSDYKRFSTRITAIMPTRQIAAHLHQPPTRPVLQTESINVDMDGRAIEYGITHFASDRTQLIVESEPLDHHAVIKRSGTPPDDTANPDSEYR
ncbi:MAG: phosphonate metabolism transcriptional regulator PhnF [Alphaproteobacteria bacterium]|nr:phosphonate metabolism transcriptional regulator PhnF [Alphaproteobacteria bacterium]